MQQRQVWKNIKTGKDEVAELKATIGSKASLFASLDYMIDAMVGTLKVLQLSISNSEEAIEETESSIEKLTEEIAAPIEAQEDSGKTC